MRIAGRIQGSRFRVFVVMSDGECNEGSVWEAAMLAPTHHDLQAYLPLAQKLEAYYRY